MNCPKCHSVMLRVPTGMAYASDPPQFPMEWRCGCGYREKAGVDRAMSPEESFLEAWRRANER